MEGNSKGPLNPSTVDELRFHDRRLSGLEGATVVSACAVLDEYDQCVPALVVQTRDGKRVQVLASRDEEFNGPGWFELRELTCPH